MGRALLVIETPQDRQKAISWINKAPVGTRVEFKASKRSLPQNDRLWAMLTDVREHMKAKGLDYSTDQFKVIFLHAWGKEIEFLPGLDGKTFVPYGQSSSDLSKEEMTSFIEFIMAWGAENGIAFHDPNTEASDARSPETSDDGDTPAPAIAPAEVSSSEPTGHSPSRPVGSEFGRFNFDEDELRDLKDFARKALDAATSPTLAWNKEPHIKQMTENYRRVLKSVEGLEALDFIVTAVDYVVDGRRKRHEAAPYIAINILGCSVADLEGRK